MSRRRYILIVDDDPAFSESLALYLDKHGYEAVQANRISRAIEALERQPIDLVLLDIRLGAEDGRSLIEPIRSRWRVPIVAITGYGSEDLAGSLVGQVDGYVKKSREFLPFLRHLARLVPSLERDPIEKGLRFLRDNLHRDLSAAEIAKAAGQSERSFRDAFEREQGETPKRRHMRERMAEAARLLAKRSELPVADIGASLGFPDVQQFSRTFQRFHKMSPSEYRAAFLSKRSPTRRKSE